MKNLKEKLTLILLPLLAGTLGVLVLYTFLNWLLLIKLNLITINDTAVDLFGPIIASFLVVYFLLRNRIKLLRLKNDHNDYFGVYMIVSFLISFPTIIAQHYLSSATGSLTPLEEINQFTTKPESKYYTLKKAYFYTKESSFHTKIEVTGKYGHRLSFTLYCAQPIFKSAKDTVATDCNYYLCTTYRDEISYRLPDNEKETLYNNFIKSSLKKYETSDFDAFSYLEVIKNNFDLKEYKKAVSENDFYNDGKKAVLLISHDTAYEDRNGGTFGWIFKALGITTGIFLLMVFFLGYKPAQKNKKKKTSKNLIATLKEDLFYLIPSKGFFVTPIITDLNLIVFIVMVFSGLGFISFDSYDLYQLGAVDRTAVFGGEWWRLLTGFFLHGGLMHILQNMITLLFIGFFLEPILGKIRYAVIYLLCGLGSSLASAFWHENGISVGASGAIFGLYGVMLALMVLKAIPKEINNILMLFSVLFIGYNLVMGIFTNSDNAAHIGGLVTGFVIGALLASKIEEEQHL